jgi:hypothetical protein
MLLFFFLLLDDRIDEYKEPFLLARIQVNALPGVHI